MKVELPLIFAVGNNCQSEFNYFLFMLAEMFELERLYWNRKYVSRFVCKLVINLWWKHYGNWLNEVLWNSVLKMPFFNKCQKNFGAYTYLWLRKYWLWYFCWLIKSIWYCGTGYYFIKICYCILVIVTVMDVILWNCQSSQLC